MTVSFQRKACADGARRARQGDAGRRYAPTHNYILGIDFQDIDIRVAMLKV
jgi:hypothetical protein